MTRHPMFGLALAAFGALVLTPDTLLMRLSGMGGIQMMAWRGLLMGAVLLALWLIIAGPARRSQARALRSGAGLAIIGCQFFNAALFALGIGNAPVAVVLLGVATVPVWSALFSRLLLGETTSRATWVTIAAVLAGIAIAVFGKDSSGVGINAASALGGLAGLGVAIVMALSFVVLRRHRAVPIVPAIGLGAFLSGVLGLAITGTAAMTDGAVWAIALSGAVILPISFGTLSAASRHAPASGVSLLLLLETVLGPAWVWLGVGETPTPPMLLGGAVVVVSLALYLQHSRRRVIPV